MNVETEETHKSRLMIEQLRVWLNDSPQLKLTTTCKGWHNIVSQVSFVCEGTEVE